MKYVFSYGPFHAAGMYTDGGSDTPILGYGYGANAGITYGGFSIDGFYTYENAAVNATFFNNPAYSGNPLTYCSNTGIAGVSGIAATSCLAPSPTTKRGT